MFSEDFKVDDLVWAKMKGYPPWPAKIAEPQSDAKSPKNKKAHYVYFFGTKDFAWILDENISPHSESMLNMLSKKKSAAYQNAVDDLINYSKSKKKEKQTLSNVKKENDSKKPRIKVVKVLNSVSKKHKRKVLMHKSGYKKMKIHKRSLENDINGDSTHSPSKSSKLHSSDHSLSDSSSAPINDEHEPDPVSIYEKYMHSIEVKHVVPTAKKIGFIGLGHMGQAIVKNLLKSGHKVTIWNRNPYKCDALVKLGAVEAKSACDVVMECEITFCCVSDPEASKTLIFGDRGVLKGLEQSKLHNLGSRGYVEMTSIDPETSSAISEAIATKNGSYLEAPVCGTSKNAEDGTLLILASGDRKLFLDCVTCFHAMGKHAYYVSCDVGYGTKMSLLLSMIYGTVCAAVAEGMALADRLNLPQQEFVKILSLGPLHCENIVEKCNSMCISKYEPVTTPLKHIQKDLNLALMMGDEQSQPMPVTAAANEVYKRARLMKYSDSDLSSVYKIIRYGL